MSDLKLEAVVIPVSDVDRAKEFYLRLGWRLDADLAGSAQNLLVVSDVVASQAELAEAGAAPTEVFHDGTGGYNRFDPGVRASGPDPERRTYASFAEFRDPDDNLWQLQEITNRLPGRVDPSTAAYSSVSDLAGALRRAEAAHGEHEARTGTRDENWPDWYAAYMVAEATGGELPT
jgi:catechol 2,3-dioxygenase-like lactoylglutathione lyase family enzyme